MRLPLVFILVLQHNNSSKTVECLESLTQLTYPHFQVVIIDNFSDQTEVDQIKKYLKSRPSRFWSLLSSSSNLGYAGGNNLGLKYALAHGADYVFILNNDTTVEPNTLDKLVKAAIADPLVGLVSPAIKEQTTTSSTLLSRTVYYGRIKWLRPELKHVLQPPAGQYLKNKDYLPGVALLIKKEVFEKIGFFDEIFFLYFEDTDFSFRAQLAGYKLKVIPEAVVFHWPSSSTRQLGSVLLLRYHLRNALIFNSLNAPWAIKSLIIFWAGYLLAKNFLKMFLWPDAQEKSDALIDGILDFYQNRFGMIKKPNNLCLK